MSNDNSDTLDKLRILRTEWSDCDRCDLCSNRVDPDTEEVDNSFQMYPYVGEYAAEGHTALMIVVGEYDAEFMYESPMECNTSLPVEFIGEVLDVHQGYIVVTTATLCPTKLPQHGRFRTYDRTEMIDAPKAKALAACLPRLLEEISIFRPKMVLVMGTRAYATLVKRTKGNYQVSGMIPLNYKWALGQMLYCEVPGTWLSDVSRATFLQPVVAIPGYWELNRREDVQNPEGLWATMYKYLERAMRVENFLSRVEGGEITTAAEAEEVLNE
jgi:uracil-DNA glycosylase